jgi:hypothetical protein
MRYQSAAGYVLLFNFLLIHILVYFVLTQLSFWQIFFIDYHLYLALIGLMVLSVLFLITKDYQVLKFFLGLEFSLHVVMIVTGVLYIKNIFPKEEFLFVHGCYPYARILIASFQITGLVANVDTDNRRGRNVRSNWRSNLRHIVNNIIRRSTSLLRVKRS